MMLTIFINADGTLITHLIEMLKRFMKTVLMSKKRKKLTLSLCQFMSFTRQMFYVHRNNFKTLNLMNIIYKRKNMQNHS